MTTWQHEQPTSRRALRESERAHAQATMSRTDEVETQQQAFDQQIWSQSTAPEPLSYTTQARPQTPANDVPMRRPRQNPAAQPASETPAYRLRDFSPESRGASFTSTQPTSPAPWTSPAVGSGDLDYHTSVELDRPAATAYSAPVSPPPVLGTTKQAEPARASAPADSDAGPDEHTLTRREMRALRSAAAPMADDPHVPASAPASAVPGSAAPASAVPPLAQAPAPAYQEAAPLAPPAPRPAASPELDAAMAEFDVLFRAKNVPPLIEPPREARVLPPQEVPAVVTPAVVAPAVAPPPSAASVVMPLPSPVAAQQAAPPQEHLPSREVVTAPEVYTRPIGHWSNQASIDDEHQVSEHSLSRNLASSDAITTSALVLPSFPQSGPFTGPVSSTGEILITGSIDLPRSLGMSGLNPSRYDRPDVDAVIDAADREDSAPDSAPVRAIRAVSTQTSSQGIINTKRPKGNNLPMILSITAGIMAVGVIVLVVAVMIFKIF